MIYPKKYNKITKHQSSSTLPSSGSTNIIGEASGYKVGNNVGDMSRTSSVKPTTGGVGMGAALGTAAAVGSAATVGGGQMDTTTDENGILDAINKKTSDNRAAADIAGTSAMTVASAFGPYGMLIGAGIKGVQLGLTALGAFDARLGADGQKQIGDIKSSKAQFKNKINTERVYGDLDRKSKMTSAYYNGGVLKHKTSIYRSGAVILGGYRHHQKNKLGDKGNPILNHKGEKIAETEREELLLNKDQTNRIETLHAKIKENPQDDMAYFDLGSEVRNIILNETKDNSGKFKELR